MNFISNIKIKLRGFRSHRLGFSSILLLYWWVILGSLLSSCVNEDTPSIEEETIPEGMTQISFIIPDYESNSAQFGTRAFNTEEEGYMSNLYVVAVKYENYDPSSGYTKILDEDRNPAPIVYTFALNPVGIKFVVGEESYKLFNIALYPGKYKFGLLSNVDLYLKRQKKISDFTKEEDLENIVLNFSEDTPLAPLHLPMACLPWEIQWSDSSREKALVNQDDYLVDVIKGKDVRIYADMKFLCSKVRYTILFDRGGISSAFGNTWIRFNVDDLNKPSASYIRKQTKLVPESTGADIDESNYFIPHLDMEGEIGSWDMSIDRFYWSSASHPCKIHKEGEGENYPLGPLCELDPWVDLTSEWIKQRQKVWQGVVYLPENLGGKFTASQTDENNEETTIESEIAKTILKFPFHTKANDLDDTPWVESPTPKEIILFGNDREEKFEGLEDGKYSSSTGSYDGLERNYFYDVVAKVKNPDQDMDIRIFISILPWHEIEQTIPNEGDLHQKDETGSSLSESVNGWNNNSYTNDW